MPRVRSLAQGRHLRQGVDPHRVRRESAFPRRCRAVHAFGACDESEPSRLVPPRAGADSQRLPRRLTRSQGSIFFVVAAEERKRQAARREARKSMTLVQKVVDSVPGPWQGWHKENKAANFEWTADKFRM